MTDAYDSGDLQTDLPPELRQGLDLTATEIDRQLKVLEELRPKLTAPDADHYVDRALGAARDLRDGTRKALDANPAPPDEKKKKKN